MSEEKPEKKEPESGILGKALKVAAYPVSAVSGFLVAAHDVRDSAYDQVKGKKNEPYRQQKDKRIEDIISEAEKIFDGGSVVTGLETKLQEAHAAQKVVLDERMKKFNLDSFRKQWKSIHRHDKGKAMIKGIEAGAIVLGAMLLVSESKIFSSLFNRDKKEEQGRE